MNFIFPYTRKSLTCELADFILNKVKLSDSKSRSRIVVNDFYNFLVIDGYTTSKDILNMNDIMEEFKKNSKTFKFIENSQPINVIDIIKYGSKKEFRIWEKFKQNYYNTLRPIYPQIFSQNFENFSFDLFRNGDESYPSYDYVQINSNTDFKEITNIISSKYITNDTSFSVSSEFPYGYELEEKVLIYFFEMISKHIFKKCNTEKITIYYENIQDTEEIIDIGKLKIETNSEYSDEIIESLVKDVFDFNLLKFKTESLEGYDFTNEILKPFEEKNWLKLDKLKDMIIF